MTSAIRADNQRPRFPGTPPPPSPFPARVLPPPPPPRAPPLPNKPLADICGEPMIVHVWRRACEAGIGPVAVATDAATIAAAVEKAGGRAVMTRDDHVSGSDRIFEAVEADQPRRRPDPRGDGAGDPPPNRPPADPGP